MKFDPILVEKLKNARHIVVFTGAGISQESGIPTFRDTLTGFWENLNPNDLATAKAFEKNPDVVWGWYESRRLMVLNCQPNSAHYAIAKMQEKTKVTVITQNVDGLHERAGSRDVIRLHGSLHVPRCFSCSKPHSEPLVVSESNNGEPLMPPKCIHCGGNIRPGVVWFNESLSINSWAKTECAIFDCDVLFSIGTSSVVYPAAVLPFEASKNGATVIQVNTQPTDLDEVANFNFVGKAGEIIPQLYQEVWGEI